MISIQPDWFFFLDVDVPLDTLSSDSSISVTVTPVWYEYIGLTWTIPATWGSCVFNIYKSESQEGPFVKITDTPTTASGYKDYNTRQTSKFVFDYYKIEVIKSDGTTVQSSPVTWINKRTDWVELRAREVQRREWLLLRKFTGVQSYIFKRRTYGQRCKLCWNPTVSKTVNPNCPECYGTSFEGGYFTPISTLVGYDAQTKTSAFNYAGKLEANEISGWTINYPNIDFKDLVLRFPDMKMFVADPIQNTELQTADVRQILKLTELSKDSVEYKLIGDFNLLPNIPVQPDVPAP